MKVKDILTKNNIIGEKKSKLGVTRDNKSIDVLRCDETGVIFLDTEIRSEKIINKYRNKENLGDHPTLGELKVEEIKNKTEKDDQRRVNMLKNKVLNKNVMDVGAGFGGFLDIISNYSNSTIAAELQKECRNHLKNRHKTYERIEHVKNNECDIATMFHVFEHMWEPLSEIKKIKDKIKKGGTLVVEVPHARDALIDLYDVDEFKKFTFWSEHLVLHTKQSIEKFLVNAGFSDVIVKGIQRYSLANHMYWMCNGEPEGGEKWSFMNEKDVNKEYEKLLSKIGKTDTLVAFCDVS